MLNPQWLRTFLALRDQGSFTRCAEHLDLTQAAVSQHVRKLEEQLGPLLIRRPRQLELTPAGHALLDYCREVGAADQRLRRKLSEADDTYGEIGLICPGSIGLVLHPMMLALQQENPGLIMRQRFAPDNEILQAVLENRYELGLTALKPDDQRISVSRFTEEPLELVAPASERINSWEDLARIGFIDHPDARAMGSRLLSRYYPGEKGIDSIPSHGFTNQISMILEPVARGLGFTILPRYARLAFQRPDSIQVIDGPVLVKDTLWLIHRSEWPLSSRAKWVIEELSLQVSSL
ncbi:LysR family transcriptional regulator [Halopseudomonas sabulinigri]|uniref:LysR family transcriptional regulator n=1 Tax=Halopseudomonas sabulinigri TaxID=472181 RepID=A0ABP9ZTA2_9GAMM